VTDALVFFVQAFTILSVISVIVAGTGWLVRKATGDPVDMDMGMYQELTPDDRLVIDAIASRYVDYTACQGFEMHGDTIMFRMLLRDDNRQFYYDGELDDVAYEVVTMTMTDPKLERRQLREILR